jgi:hypothetical protein
VKNNFSTHNICTKYIENANITCDEPIKKGLSPINKKKGSYLPTYLGLSTYLPMPTYQMARLD